MPINVVLADDHKVILEGIKLVLESEAKDIKIMFSAFNGEDVLKYAREHPADIYLLDISMPVLNGFETAKMLIEERRDSKIIFLSMHESRDYVEKAISIGVKGYLIKTDSFDRIAAAIREVNEGKFYISPSISKYLVEGFLKNGAKPEFCKLSKKEKEVALLICDGLTDKQIASKIGIAFRTARNHHSKIMKKLNIHKKTDLIKIVLQNKEKNIKEAA